jgi:N-formylglutamate amidohydrolase
VGIHPLEAHRFFELYLTSNMTRRSGISLRFLPFFIVSSVAAVGCAGNPPVEPVDPVLRVEAIAGNGESTITGGSLAPTVRVTRDGVPAAGVNVRFDAVAGEGEVARHLVATGPDGSASTLWILGPEAGVQRLVASVESTSTEFSGTAQIPQDGAAYFARNDFAEYVAGRLPIIISAGHGGDLQPGQIPDRTYGSTVQDLNTADLARRIAAELQRQTGQRPHLVISHLHRRKLDPNREIVEAAQGNILAENTWFEYHAFLETASRAVTREHGGGFLLDVHGHGHEIQRLELGYLLSASDLDEPDAVLDEARFVARSSIRQMAEASSRPFSDIIRGDLSLGSLLVAGGYPAVPSASDRAPGTAPYFTGGYTTARHGSRDGGAVNAIQLEANRIGVRDTAENRQRFAEAMAAAILQHLSAHTALAAGASPALLVGAR